MSDDNVHERINKLNERVVALETQQPFLRDLLERNIASDEKLSSTLYEMQTSMALMNEKMDNQATAFEDFRTSVENTNKSTNAKIEEVHEEVGKLKEKGSFDIYGYIKAKLPWIIVLIGAGAVALSQFVNF